MLESMRRGAQTWVAKLLFGLLVLSFSVWGVADVFTGWGRGAVATVGSQAITADEFSRQFQSELDRFSEQAKTRLTAEQGRALGLDRRVLNQLMANAAFESHAAQLGLSLSDATVADLVANDPDFVGPDGKFSRMAFNSILRQIGLSEQAFIALRRRDEIRNQLLGAFVKGQTVSKPMIELMHAYENETRVIEYVNVNPDKVPAVTEPDDAKLKELYEAGKSQYMTPELKKFEVLMLTVDDLKKTIEVSDEDIAKTFEATKDSYSVPEQRRIQQIAFKDKAAADAAKVALDGGKSFGDVAKDAGAKDTDADLGLIAKKSLIDKTIADAAFALEKDKISDVIVGRFATVLLRVTQIEPGVVKSLADVKDQVKDKLASEKARTALQDKHDDIDDNRNAGKTLKDIADSMKLTYKEIAGADKNGMMLDGKPALETPDLRKIMTNVFAPDAGADQPAIDLTDGGYAWVNPLATEPPKQMPFDDVKAEVKAKFLDSEKSRLISELAKSLADRVIAGEPMSAIEEAAGNKVTKTDPVTRSTVPQGLSQGAVSTAFALTVGKAAVTDSADKSTRAVIKVDDVKPAAAPTTEQNAKLTQELQQNLVEQVLTGYAATLSTRLGASVNDVELKRALGVTEQ